MQKINNFYFPFNLLLEHKNITGVLIGGSRAVGFNDMLSDYEIGIFSKKNLSKIQRIKFYNKINAEIFSIGCLSNKSTREQNLFGYADKIQYKNQEIDIIWITEPNLKNIAENKLNLLDSNFGSLVSLLSNLNRGKWILKSNFLNTFVTSSADWYDEIKFFLLKDRYHISRKSDIQKYILRNQWQKLAAELYLIFDSFAYIFCLENRIYPLSSKWLLKELENLNPSIYNFWKNTFSTLYLADLKSIEAITCNYSLLEDIGSTQNKDH